MNLQDEIRREYEMKAAIVDCCIRLLCTECAAGRMPERSGIVFRHPMNLPSRRQGDWKLCPALPLHCWLAALKGQEWAAKLRFDFDTGSVWFE